MKKIFVLILCCCLTFSLSACKNEKNSETKNKTTNSIASSSDVKKRFSSEEEFKKYSNGFWVCDTNHNDSQKYYKIRVFDNGICLDWDFSYPANQTLADCLKGILVSYKENANISFNKATKLLTSDCTNIEGIKFSIFEIQYDYRKGEINASDGQSIATFFDNGTAEINDDIYTHSDNCLDLQEAFVSAKISLFQEEHGELVTYKDVKYDPSSHFNSYFLLTGSAELDDYYNYDYRDLESMYFCVCVTPTGGGFSDRWYIYCSRSEYDELFEELKKGSISNICMICRGMYYDSLPHEMANLFDYCLW